MKGILCIALVLALLIDCIDFGNCKRKGRTWRRRQRKRLAAAAAAADAVPPAVAAAGPNGIRLARVQTGQLIPAPQPAPGAPMPGIRLARVQNGQLIPAPAAPMPAPMATMPHVIHIPAPLPPPPPAPHPFMLTIGGPPAAAPATAPTLTNGFVPSRYPVQPSPACTCPHCATGCPVCTTACPRCAMNCATCATNCPSCAATCTAPMEHVPVMVDDTSDEVSSENSSIELPQPAPPPDSAESAESAASEDLHSHES